MLMIILINECKTDVSFRSNIDIKYRLRITRLPFYPWRLEKFYHRVIPEAIDVYHCVITENIIRPLFSFFL